jgi:hypothetical protein
MILNKDCVFQIGSSHRICEDFALCGQNQDGSRQFALVSDGCSSALVNDGVRYPLNVDTGARMVSLAAAKAVMECRWPNDIDIEKDMILDNILGTLRTMRSIFNLPKPIFDATLLLALCEGRASMRLFWFGDGVMVRENESFLKITIQEYQSGAPYYLSYELDEARKNAYLNEFANSDQKMVKTTWFLNKKTQEINECSAEFYPTRFTTEWITLLPHDYEIFTLFSDGILSFNQEDRIAIIRECSDYKSKVGSFVWRRMNLTNMWKKKNQFVHYDDLGMAAISCQKEVVE